MKVPYVVAVIAVALAITVSSIVISLPRTEHWEHEIVQTTYKDARNSLKESQRDGWELIQVSPDPTSKVQVLLWMKRTN